MKYIYISFGSFVWGVFYEIHIYIIWVFCPGFFAMKYIYYIYIIWVFCPGFFSMKYMYISSGCFVWGVFSYEIHIYIIWVFCLTFGMSRLLLATIIAVIFLNGLGVVFFFFRKNLHHYFVFPISAETSLSRTAVTWTECCRYSVKHKTINQPFVCEELWSIVLYTLKCYSKPILNPNIFNMLNISLPVSKNTKLQ